MVSTLNGISSLDKNIKNLFTLITDIENEQNQKKGLIGNMNHLLKAMLKGDKFDVGTQVHEGDLLWNFLNLNDEEILLENNKFNKLDDVNLGSGSFKDNTVNI